MSAPASSAPPGRASRASAARESGLRRLEHRSRAMGGRLVVGVVAPGSDAADAELGMRRAAARVRAWASILTRHDPGSQLMRLNDDPRGIVDVRPTLAAAFGWAREAGAITAGTVDVTLLDARLSAELDDPATATHRDVGVASPGSGAGSAARWDIRAGGRHRSGTVVREPHVRFDLDGIGKGWLADRVLAHLTWPGAFVDADGDVAVRSAPGDSWEIGIGDPRDDDLVLAVLALPGSPSWPRTYGVATSGISVHRWGGTGTRHHLIDPATRAPAPTDVVQATVLAMSAREAEAWAKTIVIRGAAAGLDLVERSDALGAVVLLADGRTVALPRTSRYLA